MAGLNMQIEWKNRLCKVGEKFGYFHADRGSTFTHIKHVREKGGKVFSCKGFEKRMKYFMYIDGKEGSTK